LYATIREDATSEVISHDSPTASIRLPIFDAIAASHIALNALYFSGDNPEEEPPLLPPLLLSLRLAFFLAAFSVPAMISLYYSCIILVRQSIGSCKNYKIVVLAFLSSK
jgi:hypothetical protein